MDIKSFQKLKPATMPSAVGVELAPTRLSVLYSTYWATLTFANRGISNLLKVHITWLIKSVGHDYTSILYVSGLQVILKWLECRIPVIVTVV